MTRKHEVTLDSLTEHLDEFRRMAVEDRKIAPGVTAVMGMARLHGLDIQQVSVTVKKEMTPEERLDALRSLLQRTSITAEPVDNSANLLEDEE